MAQRDSLLPDKPYIVPFDVEAKEPIAPGTTGPLLQLSGICEATYTPLDRQPNHWDVTCPNLPRDRWDTLLSQAAKKQHKPAQRVECNERYFSAMPILTRDASIPTPASGSTELSIRHSV